MNVDSPKIFASKQFADIRILGLSGIDSATNEYAGRENKGLTVKSVAQTTPKLVDAACHDEPHCGGRDGRKIELPLWGQAWCSTIKASTDASASATRRPAATRRAVDPGNCRQSHGHRGICR